MRVDCDHTICAHLLATSAQYRAISVIRDGILYPHIGIVSTLDAVRAQPAGTLGYSVPRRRPDGAQSSRRFSLSEHTGIPLGARPRSVKRVSHTPRPATWTLLVAMTPYGAVHVVDVTDHNPHHFL
ncbi:MAG: hypothetical protein JWL61_3784 [Gemmatimonadetes bacterium]|nr:hypothetical protein [Gemmatimonadota bacterium]